MWKRQIKYIPDGVQTYSKMPDKHVEGVYPKMIHHAQGAYVYDYEGNKYVDYPCALGAIILGYRHPVVRDAVLSQLNKGILFSLPNDMEGKVAEKIVDLIPCAEKVKFVKTGSEATSAAVKIARAYTGKDNIVCMGYHGWHDWYNVTTPKNKGVPHRLKAFCKQAKYNDLEGVKRHVTKNTAAIILEPYIYDAPKDGFLEKLEEYCRNNNILMIFDEVVTGLRTPGGSAQKYFNVTPDLACFGKPFANGLPLGIVCGKADLMDVTKKDCFVSSTFGGELLSLAACDAVLDFWRKNNVDEQIATYGMMLKKGFNQIANTLDGTECVGFPCRTFFKFPTEAHKSLFWQECIKRGVLFGYAQFINYAHNGPVMDETLTAMRDAMEIVKDYWENPERGLHGNTAQETFRHEAVQ